LRLTLDEKAREMKVTSPEFPVQPWTLYRVRLRQNTDLGANLIIGIELNAPDGGWRKASYYLVPDAGGMGLFGTFPDSAKARLSLTLQVPGKALGRASVVDDIRILRETALIKETGLNLFWDGGFELTNGDMSHWVYQPQKFETSTNRPRNGKRCFHVESDKWTYVVFPYVPVQPHRLYRFRCYVRGKGAVYPGMHKIGTQDYASIATNIMPRVGWAWPLVETVTLKPDEWQPVELLTPCESDRILWFNVILTFPGSVLDVDDVELVSLAQ
jgi:hypothetical protein